jgi:hypothetical protein
MNYNYALLDSFYLSEKSITGRRIYHSGIYRIVEILNPTSVYSDKYMLVYIFGIELLHGACHPITEHSLETLFQLSLIEEYEYYETN